MATIEGTLKTPLAGGRKQFVTARIEPDLAHEIDKAVRELVDATLARSLGLLAARRGTREAGAKRLPEKETLTDVDLREIVAAGEATPGTAGSVPRPAQA